MIFGIGTDIVRIDRVQQGLEKFGERFATRLLHNSELEVYKKDTRQAYFLAKRFAAKEAVVKALGTGFRDGMSLRQIAIGHDQLGRPTLQYYGRVLEVVEEKGIGEGFVSIADEHDYAIAFVTLMTKP